MGFYPSVRKAQKISVTALTKVMNSFILVLIAILIFAVGAGLYFYE